MRNTLTLAAGFPASLEGALSDCAVPLDAPCCVNNHSIDGSESELGGIVSLVNQLVPFQVRLITCLQGWTSEDYPKPLANVVLGLGPFIARSASGIVVVEVRYESKIHVERVA